MGMFRPGRYPRIRGWPETPRGVAILHQKSQHWRVIRFLTIAASVGLALAMESAGAETAPAKPSQAGVEIRSVTVGGKALPLRPGEAVRLPAFPENVAFGYGATGKSNPAPTRLRYKLEGYDHQWHESWGQMFLAIRFLDEAGEQVARKTWNVSGESPGWNGELASATLNHRRETLVVPPGAARFQVSISSGGPAGTVGIYVVDGLVVSILSGAASTRGAEVAGWAKASRAVRWRGWASLGAQRDAAEHGESGRNWA